MILNAEYYKISELDSAGTLDGSEFVEVSSESGTSFDSKKISIETLSNCFVNMEFDDLQTTNKTIIGALNELASR